MGHVRRMQHNRRHLIYKMIKEKELEKSNSRQHDELSEREGEVSPSERDDLPAESSGYRRTSRHYGSN